MPQPCAPGEIRDPPPAGGKPVISNDFSVKCGVRITAEKAGFGLNWPATVTIGTRSASMSSGHVVLARRLAAVGLAILAVAWAGWDEAEARTARQQEKQQQVKQQPAKQQQAKQQPRQRAVHGPSYRPPYAAIVVDDNSGEVLHAQMADEPRHPASLTKIMTLYLLFEQLEAGKIKLDTPFSISQHAVIQRPVKLGLKVNQTLICEDAIKGLVTKSANDAAAVVAEALAGSEEEFAKLMTQKARALGMMSTVYINASGLPAEEQITTARDQALLGRAIQHRFPEYYRYFATPSFRYRGIEMRNHNQLLGQVQGVDGIKTGYTDASGYNLVSSVWRNEKHIVAVVLGGTSNAARDARMRQLIEEHIPLATTQRTAPRITETAEPEAKAATTFVDTIGPAAPAQE
jgi:D-alanyl-D-alanine carboxypeptidase